MQIKIYKMGNKLGIHFPKNKQIHQKGDLILLTINKDSKEVKLITKFNYNIIIRKDFVNKLKLKQKDIIDIKTNKIKNLQRTKKLFYNNKIDLLSLIPKKTSRGYEIIVSKFSKNNKEWLRLWYFHNRGSGRQLELKRYIDIKKFGSLLGQYQAEGNKPINSKYPKYKVEFKNKLIDEHKEFLKSLLDFGINKNKLKARFHYNPSKLSEKEIKNHILRFKNKINIIPRLAPHKKTKGIGFGLHIDNTILMEIILNALKIVRSSFNENIKNKEYKILINNFFAKLLTGDGTLDIRTKNREYDYPTTRIKITDQNKDYLKSYKKLMENLKFNPKILFKHISVRSHCGIHHLLYLYKIKAFKNTNNWNKLLLNIDLALKGRRLSTLKRYLDLVNYEKFNTLKIVKDYNICIRAAYDWLDNATKGGYIIKVNKKYIPGQPNIWATTSKAKKLVNTLNLWQQDLINLKEEKRIQDSLSLLNSLKVKVKNSTEEGTYSENQLRK